MAELYELLCCPSSLAPESKLSRRLEAQHSFVPKLSHRSGKNIKKFSINKSLFVGETISPAFIRFLRKEVMQYSIQRLADINPVLCEQLRQYCYNLNGCCQEVHRTLGPFLNEYIYQEALSILFTEQDIPYQREYYFTVNFHGHALQHKHYVDFLCMENVIIECKSVDTLGSIQRQQLWNYMRLTKIPIGILVNFAPVQDQCEHYYLDTATDSMYLF